MAPAQEVAKPSITFSPEVIKGWHGSRPHPRTLWDSPWPFLTLMMAIVTAFAILVMAVMLYRQQAQIHEVHKLRDQLVAQKNDTRNMAATIISLAKLTETQGKTLGSLLNAQSAEYKILRRLMRGVTVR